MIRIWVLSSTSAPRIGADVLITKTPGIFRDLIMCLKFKGNLHGNGIYRIPISSF